MCAQPCNVFLSLVDKENLTFSSFWQSFPPIYQSHLDLFGFTRTSRTEGAATASLFTMQHDQSEKWKKSLKNIKCRSHLLSRERGGLAEQFDEAESYHGLHSHQISPQWWENIYSFLRKIHFVPPVEIQTCRACEKEKAKPNKGEAQFCNSFEGQQRLSEQLQSL